MIYQCYFRAEQQKHLCQLPLYKSIGISPEINPQLSLDGKLCRLLCEGVAMLELYKRPPNDGHDWIGLSSWRDYQKRDYRFNSSDLIEHWLEKFNGIAWYQMREPYDSLAHHGEDRIPGVTSFMLKMSVDMKLPIPHQYFTSPQAAWCNYWILKKNDFYKMMEWLAPQIEYIVDNRNHWFMKMENRGGGHVVERQFINWCWINKYKLYDPYWKRLWSYD
jgi:hypothetical protein